MNYNQAISNVFCLVELLVWNINNVLSLFKLENYEL